MSDTLDTDATRHDAEEASSSRVRERGQAAVEFAIFIPILCMLLIAIIEYGLMIATSMDLASATRDGARTAAVSRNDDDPVASVTAAFEGSLDRVGQEEATVQVIGGWDQDDEVIVRGSTPYELDIMGLEVWEGNLTSESVVRIG